MQNRLESLFIGFSGGFISAGFGLGGGVFILPLLILFRRDDIRSLIPLSLGAIIPITLISLGIHWPDRSGDPRHILILTTVIGSIAGTFAGKMVIERLRSDSLSLLYSIFLLIMTLEMAGILPHAALGGDFSEISLFTVFFITGLLAGISATLFGIGGGIIMIPSFTILVGLPHLDAIITSLAVILPTSAAAFLQHTYGHFHKLRQHGLPMIVLGGAIGAAAGLLFSHQFRGIGFRLAFALFLFIIWANFSIQIFRKDRS